MKRVDGVRAISENSDFRKITLRFAEVEGFDENTSLGQIAEGLKGFNANAYDVVIGLNEIESLGKEKAFKTVMQALKDRNKFKKAELKMGKGEASRDIDLLNDVIEKDVIVFQVREKSSLGNENVWDKMLEKFNERRSAILSSLGRREDGN